MQQPYGATPLSARQRMEIAKVSGRGQRLAYGSLNHVPRDRAVAELHQISTDPVVFGIALGGALCELEVRAWAHAQALVDLYRAAGADEDVAAANLEWHWQRPEFRNRWRWADYDRDEQDA